MNRKRKILTLVALAVFSAIILSHYSTIGWHWVPSGKLREKSERNQNMGRHLPAQHAAMR
jgi:hypothetical protein